MGKVPESNTYVSILSKAKENENSWISEVHEVGNIKKAQSNAIVVRLNHDN